MSRPVAQAVSKKTGIPAATITRGIEMLLPVLLAVLSRRAAKGAATPPPAGAPGAATPGTATPGATSKGGLGDLLGSILGGGKK
ncbi:hypothetical protein [Streptomyces sp. NPDC005408]|uniref:hypothetical protein n=1 Tax=Streptomyces sp. NPDC005408 TaxID=3155341 RepID=UPI0033A9BAAA